MSKAFKMFKVGTIFKMFKIGIIFKPSKWCNTERSPIHQLVKEIVWTLDTISEDKFSF